MQRFFYFLFVTIFLFFTSCTKGPPYGDIPSKIRIKAKGALYIRTAPDSQSSIIGIVRYQDVCKVLDAFPVFYKISLPDGLEGWISANPHEQWTTRVDENLVKVNLEGGLAVRKEPFNKESEQIGVAAKGYTFDIRSVIYSHYKIISPEGKKGWIYIGRPNQSMIEEVFLP